MSSSTEIRPIGERGLQTSAAILGGEDLVPFGFQV